MYCRNCANQVNDKAVACPKCGVDPKKEKKFCSSCGEPTNENQVICTKCGVSLASKGFSLDTSALQGFDAAKFFSDRSHIAALVALVACFLPWLTVKMFGSQSLHLFNLTSAAEHQTGHILVPFLLYLFPLTLLAYLAANYVPQITKHKKWFATGALVLIIYAAIGLYQISHPSLGMAEGGDGLGGMFQDSMRKASRMVQDMISVGWGFYLSAAATVTTFVLARRA